MALIWRTQSIWSGFPGSPGYTSFHFRLVNGDGTEAQAVADASRAFWVNIQSLLQQTTQIQVSADVNQYEETTAVLANVVTVGTPPTVVAGTSPAIQAGPAGAAITWLTNTIRNGRKLRGRTFLVPLTSAAYEANGTLAAGARTTLITAAGNLLGAAGADLVVWGRPKPSGLAGIADTATGSQVSDRVAILRSRR